jgi:hypothetical protein
VVDGFKGFHQVRIHPGSHHLTTFIFDGLGCFQYKRMPMGWCGSSDAQNTCIVAAGINTIPNMYRVVKDILVATDTWPKHMQRVEDILCTCTVSGIKLNCTKVQFGLPQGKFGSYIICHGGYEPDSTLTAALANFPQPCMHMDL